MSKSDEKKASKKARKTEKVEKLEKTIEREKSSKSKSKKDKSSAKPSSAFGVVAASKSAFDPTISSLFANSVSSSIHIVCTIVTLPADPSIAWPQQA